MSFGEIELSLAFYIGRSLLTRETDSFSRFCVELFALSTAWIVIFGDSLHSVLPQFSADIYKVVGFFVVLPTTLLPLRLLSIPSLLSLISSFAIIVILLIDGFSKTTAPGSILHPTETSLLPDLNNANVLGGLGLLIAGFGGHAIIPSLAIDMRHPEKFNRVVNVAYVSIEASFGANTRGDGVWLEVLIFELSLMA